MSLDNNVPKIWETTVLGTVIVICAFLIIKCEMNHNAMKKGYIQTVEKDKVIWIKEK